MFLAHDVLYIRTARFTSNFGVSYQILIAFSCLGSPLLKIKIALLIAFRLRQTGAHISAAYNDAMYVKLVYHINRHKYQQATLAVIN
jgi:hypothetical protein